jgi:hypothetical protein
MAMPVAEMEALPELAAAHEGECEAAHEGEEFLGSLAGAAQRGWNWLTAPQSLQRRLALSAARTVLNRGLPALGRVVGGRLGSESAGGEVGTSLGSILSGILPSSEMEAEWEAEINPIRKVYPDALMEHLGHAAMEAESETEAEASIGALVPLAARMAPRATASILRAAPGLICGAAGLARTLRSSPATRPLVRVIPTIVRRTVADISRQVAHGRPVTAPAAVRTLARQTARILTSPRQAAQDLRRSRILDTQFHRAAGVTVPRLGCPRCGYTTPARPAQRRRV